MSMTSTTRPTRTAFERKCARLASHHERQEARRAVAFARLAEDARNLVQWGVEQGLMSYPKHKDTSK